MTEDEGMVEEQVAIEDGCALVRVEELMVWSKLARGDYNKNQAYAHLRVIPAIPWVIKVPVGELEGLDALKAVSDALHGIVADSAQQKVEEIEAEEKAKVQQGIKAVLTKQSGVEVRTAVRTTDSSYVGRPNVQAATGAEPDSIDDDF